VRIVVRFLKSISFEGPQSPEEKVSPFAAGALYLYGAAFALRGTLNTGLGSESYGITGNGNMAEGTDSEPGFASHAITLAEPATSAPASLRDGQMYVGMDLYLGDDGGYEGTCLECHSRNRAYARMAHHGATVDVAPSVGVYRLGSRRDTERDLARSWSAWLTENREGLLKDYNGQYVAMVSGQVVESGPTELGVNREVGKRFGNRSALIYPVSQDTLPSDR
jgi:hypothetical protein